jgi:glycogen(starch) synthase
MTRINPGKRTSETSSRKVRILIQRPHSTDISGVDTYVGILRDSLATRDFDVRVVTTGSDSLRQRLLGVVWADATHLNSNDFFMVCLARLLGKRLSLKIHWPFWLSTKDVYVPCTPLRRLWVECQYLVQRYGHRTNWRPMIRAYSRLLMRIIVFRIVTDRLACSQFTARACDTRREVRGIPNPFAFEPLSFQKSTPEEAPMRFLYVGRLAREKGVDLILEAAYLLEQSDQNFEVIIVGDGPEMKALKTMTASMALEHRILFKGRRPTNEVNELYRSAIAVIQPARWEEPAGYTPVEAAAQGTMSIVSAVGGLQEMAGPAALLFDRGDYRQLSTHMLTCIENPTDASERGLRARQFATATFSPDVALKDLLPFFVPNRHKSKKQPQAANGGLS